MFTYPPKITHSFIETGCKHRVDVTKDRFVILEGQLLPQEPHNVFKSLVARAFEAWLAQLWRVRQRRETDRDYCSHSQQCTARVAWEVRSRSSRIEILVPNSMAINTFFARRTFFLLQKAGSLERLMGVFRKMLQDDRGGHCHG